jgi:hypothetical protein
MRIIPALAAASVITMFAAAAPSHAGQPRFAAGAPDIPISHQDRVYAAEQYSNTVSVTDPVENNRCKSKCRHANELGS